MLKSVVAPIFLTMGHWSAGSIEPIRLITSIWFASIPPVIQRQSCWKMSGSLISLHRICTHIIAFEGESIAKMYISNWADYETMMMEKFGKDLTPLRVKYRTLKR